MRKFNIEEAKAGKPVCTRSGLSARIICFNVKRESYPIITVIENKGKEFVVSHNLDGSYCDDKENDLDLFMTPEKHECWGWVSSSNNMCAFIYKTKEEALTHKPDREYFLAKIEWEE